MNEFEQDYENEKDQWLMHRSNYHIKIIDTLFRLANLLRSRFEIEMQRNATTEEYIEMIKISSLFMNKQN